jgi:hypothetical protein
MDQPPLLALKKILAACGVPEHLIKFACFSALHIQMISGFAPMDLHQRRVHVRNILCSIPFGARVK